jgi:hypothetical protein
MAFITHPHLALRLKKEYSYTSTPLWAFMSCSRMNFSFYGGSAVARQLHWGCPQVASQRPKRNVSSSHPEAPKEMAAMCKGKYVGLAVV